MNNYNPNKNFRSPVDESMDIIDEANYDSSKRKNASWLTKAKYALGGLAAIGLAYAGLHFASGYTDKMNYNALSKEYSNVVETAKYNYGEASKEAEALVSRMNEIQRDRNINPSTNVSNLIRKIKSDFEARGLVSKY